MTAKLYAYGYADVRTYLFAALFVVGNVVLPQLVHLIPQGGLTWLPIYFFTLVGAYKYGWRVGLLTAIVSPLVNSFFFGMPVAAMLPGIMGRGCGLCRPPFPSCFVVALVGCRGFLSVGRDYFRVDHERQSFCRCTGLPSRDSRHGGAGLRWVFVH